MNLNQKLRYKCISHSGAYSALWWRIVECVRGGYKENHRGEIKVLRMVQICAR